METISNTFKSFTNPVTSKPSKGNSRKTSPVNLVVVNGWLKKRSTRNKISEANSQNPTVRKLSIPENVPIKKHYDSNERQPWYKTNGFPVMQK